MIKNISLFLICFYCCSSYGQWNNSIFKTKKYSIIYEDTQKIRFKIYENVTTKFIPNSSFKYHGLTPENALMAFRLLPENQLDQLFYSDFHKKEALRMETGTRAQQGDFVITSKENETGYQLIFKLDFEYFNVPTALIKVAALGYNREPMRYGVYCFQKIDNRWYMVSFTAIDHRTEWLMKALKYSKTESLLNLIKSQNPNNIPLLKKMIDKTTYKKTVFDFNAYVEEMALAAKNKDKEFYDYFCERLTRSSPLIYYREKKRRQSSMANSVKYFSAEFYYYPYKDMELPDNFILPFRKKN